MAAIVVPDASRVILTFVNNENSVTWTNALAAHITSGYDETDADTIANGIGSQFAAHWAPRMNASCEFTGCKVTDLGSLTGAEGFSAFSESGTVDGNIATVDQCLVATLFTGVRGRSNRGRAFFRGMSVADYEDNNGTRTWKADTVSTCLAAIETVIGNLQAESLPLAVVSRLHSSFREVSAAEVRNGIFSQRRTGRPAG